jgi:hypothetical protein
LRYTFQIDGKRIAYKEIWTKFNLLGGIRDWFQLTQTHFLSNAND